MADYRLSAVLQGHADDVRAVVFPNPGTVMTASRDGTTRVWLLDTSQPPSVDSTISSHGPHFMNAVAYCPPSKEYPQGLIISGGKDIVIEVRQPGTPPDSHAEALLVGHAHNVCALDVDPTGQWIVSGSWDGTARIWKVGKWDCEVNIDDHEGSVWAVMFWDEKTIVTGSADKHIRVFHLDGTLLKTIRGIPDVVRALCRVPANHPSGAQLASATNDGIIRLWTLDGRPRGELHGHDSFIYSLASLPSGELISSGEDRTLRIWKGTDCIQTITHPAISVWGVAACAESGDFVSGASDRIARVFTRDPQRQAAQDVLEAFEESVKLSSIPQQQIGDINKEKLAGPEFLQQKRGTKEGQVVMIREDNGNVTAHQWSTGAQQWINVGTVVDTVGSSGRKKEYLGEDYDYVFDVDIKEGAPPLKLPYNLSQNPYEAATKFLQENELPMTYLDQVANFITTNVRGATIDQSQQDTTPANPGPDPFGTESRYRPGDGAAAASSSYTSPPAATSGPKKLPQTTYLSNKQANLKAIQKKIEELNQELIKDGKKDLSLNPSDLNILHEIIGYLETATTSTPTATATATSQPRSTTVISAGLTLVLRIIMLWPPTHRLPGLDLLRLLAAAETQALAKYRSSTNETIIDMLERSGIFSDSERSNNMMMAVRTFVNLFETVEGRDLMKEKFDMIYPLTSHIQHKEILLINRNLVTSFTTMMINYSVFYTTSYTSGTTTKERLEHVTRAIIPPLQKIIRSPASDSEIIYRCLVAIGTLLHFSDLETGKWALYSSRNENVEHINGGKGLGVLSDAKKIREKFKQPRITDVVGEIEELAKSKFPKK